MANTFTQLSYANTFGDWVITTNYHSTELNSIGKGNYIKDTGLLTLASPGIALQVANNSLFQGNVVITGTGQALQVSKDVYIGGNLWVGGNTTISLDEIILDEVYVNGIISNTANIIILSSNVITANVSVSTPLLNASVANVSNLVSNSILNRNWLISNTIVANTSVTTNTVTSNVIVANTITTVNETVSGTLTVNSLAGVANNQIYQTISDTGNNAISTALAFSIALG
jgi:hypothetical protein